MVTPEQIDLFTSLFRGRPDAYARYWEKNGRSGYSPAYAFDYRDAKVSFLDRQYKQRQRYYNKLKSAGP